jgi:hypothetical protein
MFRKKLIVKRTRQSKAERRTRSAAVTGLLTHVNTNADAGFPLKKRVRMVYGAQFILTNGGAPNQATVFRCNDLYDPDQSGVGHQPRGFDQLLAAAGPYTKFVVHSCDVRATFINTVATNPTTCFLHYSKELPAVADFAGPSDPMEIANTTWQVLSGAGLPGHIAELRQFVDNKNILARKDLEDDDDVHGAYNATPSQVTYVIMGVAGGVGTASVNIFLQLVYDATLYGRAQLPGS